MKSDEAELARLQRQRDAMPAFVATDDAAVTAAKRAADTASDNRRAECGNGDPKQRGPNCRQREVDEKDAADRLPPLHLPRSPLSAPASSRPA